MAYKYRKPMVRRNLRRNRKRWYVNARIGKNVPLIGGTGISFGSQKIRRMVRRELAKRDENKTYYNTFSSGALTHNTLYTWSATQALVKGTSQHNRVGNSIYARYLKIRVSVNVNAGAPYFQGRLITLYSPDRFIAPPNGFYSSIGSSDLFITPLPGNVIDSLIDGKKFSGNRIICDKKFTMRAQSTLPIGGAEHKMYQYTCPLFRKLTYDDNDTGYLKNGQIYTVFIPYIGGGTNGVSLVQGIEVQQLLTYTDD